MDQADFVIEYEGSLEASEYEHGWRLHSRYAASVTDYLLACGLLVVLLVAAFVGDGWASLLIFVALLLYLLQTWRARSSYRRQIREQFSQSAPLKAHFRSRFDASGFRTTSEYFDDRRPWDQLQKWREDEEVFLLYETHLSFRVIPKRLLRGPGQVAALQALLRQRLGPAT